MQMFLQHIATCDLLPHTPIFLASKHLENICTLYTGNSTYTIHSEGTKYQLSFSPPLKYRLLTDTIAAYKKYLSDLPKKEEKNRRN